VIDETDSRAVAAELDRLLRLGEALNPQVLVSVAGELVVMAPRPVAPTPVLLGPPSPPEEPKWRVHVQEEPAPPE
jgi:hypothetical protein